jgi:hypothetical protein
VGARPDGWALANASLYLNNAFRVLGLPVNADERAVRARAKEQTLRLELSAADPKDIQRVRAAEAALLDPRRRMKEELFAPHLAPGLGQVDAVLNSEGSDQPIAGAPETTDPVEAEHDLAVREHATAIVLAPADTSVWRGALARWFNTWNSKEFALLQSLRAGALQDPRANDAAVADLLKELPGLVLGPSTVAAEHFLELGNTELAGRHIAAIVDSGFPEDAVQHARQLATIRARDQLRETSNRLAAAARGDRNGPQALHGLLLDVWRQAQSEVLPLAEVLGQVDANGPEVVVSLEQTADFLRSLSLRFNNEVADPTTALEIVRAALALPISELRRASLLEDERVLTSLVSAPFDSQVERAASLARQRNFKAAISEIRVALEVARAEDQRRRATELMAEYELAERRRTRWFGVPRWVWGWAAVLLAVVLVVSSLGSTSGTTSNRPSPTPTSRPQTSSQSNQKITPVPPTQSTAASSNSSKDTQRQRLDTLQKELDAQQAELDQRDAALDPKRADIDAQRTHLEEMESQYPSGASSDVVAQYETLRSHFNDDVDAFNRELAAVKTLNATYNDKVAEYNRLLDQLRNTAN